jgi:hypothetical protein
VSGLGPAVEPPRRRVWPRLWDTAFVALGLVLLAVGLLGAFADPELFVLALLGLAALSVRIGVHVPGVRDPRPRVTQRGTVTLDGYPSTINAARIGLAVAAVPLAVWIAALELEHDTLAVVSAMVAFAAILVVLQRTGGLHQLRIDQEGLWWQLGGPRRRIPWEALSDVRTDGANLIAGPTTLPLAPFAVDPHQLAEALKDYAHDPERRTGVTTATIVDRLR